MKSGLEMVIDVAKLLDVPELTGGTIQEGFYFLEGYSSQDYALGATTSVTEGKINGRIWQHQRPANSDTVDIVVNSLALTNQQLQQGVVNVNIHVPNQVNVIGGKQDSTMPDLAKMLEIGKIVTGILETNWQYDFHTEIYQPGQPYQDGAGWYLNIRVMYYSFQNNYQNI
ncbi:hypothetical protein FVR03_01345 [Pontibacter qinzhouensis]|uniref:Uncharacterized protein n=1 Tax=Pontibacter qinzhouensis TaxID=2603253 RepID=A0A5C8KBB5_9BACT|nr:hypothetical protein [Pontibacter qinzhouensis]TXK52389.1 hypothetical protein FVR03_01345 [Pontibacter qinzhouensis]